ncbi:hypothetical protein HZ326_8055 [Fusarium oxysporum f. sp. albedinis]|nr:hypothetical protein HZ326_8055 [Fusarium oxysporum f. sp. albedinis]
MSAVQVERGPSYIHNLMTICSSALSSLTEPLAVAIDCHVVIEVVGSGCRSWPHNCPLYRSECSRNRPG